MQEKLKEAIDKTLETCMAGTKKAVLVIDHVTVQTYWCGTVLRTDIKGLRDNA